MSTREHACTHLCMEKNLELDATSTACGQAITIVCHASPAEPGLVNFDAIELVSTLGGETFSVALRPDDWLLVVGEMVRIFGKATKGRVIVHEGGGTQ